MHIGFIGFGSIGRDVQARLGNDRSVTFCALTRSMIENPPPGLAQVRTLDALLATRPDLVVECAGHGAVANHASAVLQAGVPLLIASLGALADEALAQRIDDAASKTGARIILPSGAIGGLDVLRAVAADGTVAIHYTGTKPPAAWKGSAADDLCSLDTLTSAITVFSGTGRDAATQFPKNANVVAALALAGGGFDRVDVKLVADPQTTQNTHHYAVSAAACTYEMTIQNAPSPKNPRTSLTTVLGIVQDIRAFMETFPQR